MKKICCYTFLALLLNLIPKINQAQWVNKYEMVGPNGAIYDIDFFKSDTGLFVGFTYDVNGNQHALVMRTVNSGNTWNPVTSGTISKSDGLYSLSCASNKIAYVGGTSFLIKSIDAGLTWDSIVFKIDNLTPATGKAFGQTVFTSISNGLAIFNQTWSGGNFIRTTNSGISWNTILSSVVSFYSNDSKNIYAISNGAFKSSADSGTSWTSSTIPSDSSASSGIRPSVYFQNANIGYITGGIHLIKTTNGGSTWSKIAVDQNDSFDLTNIQFIDSLNGFITATMGRFFRTTDGGNTWKKVFVPNGILSIYQLDLVKPYYFNKNKACVLAVAGDIQDIMVNNNLQLTTGIDEALGTINIVKVFPNPVNDILNISIAPQSSSLNLQLFNITGKLLKSLTTSKSDLSIDVSELSNGVYFCVIAGNSLTCRQKIIINR